MGSGDIFILALALISVVLSGYALWRDETLNWVFAVPRLPAPDPGEAPLFETLFDYRPKKGVAHSPAIVKHGETLSTLWFEGSSEAQPDIEIRRAVLETGPEGGCAGDPETFLTSAALAKAFAPGQLVVTLGNTIQNDAIESSLYATVVSVGGWAMASIAEVRMDGVKPVRVRKLDLSPFLNRSFLVRSPMVAYADGSHALPAYFEMGTTYGALVRLDAEGRVRDQRRMTGTGVKPIQPMIVVLDETRALAFLRDFDDSGRLYLSRTEDGGRHWTRAEATDIPHPNAPVAALSLSGGRILMARNGSGNDADRLELAVSADEGESWQVIHRIDSEAGEARYPMLRRLADGRILLAYSHHSKQGVRVVMFNEAWVAAR